MGYKYLIVEFKSSELPIPPLDVIVHAKNVSVGITSHPVEEFLYNELNSLKDALGDALGKPDNIDWYFTSDESIYFEITWKG